MKLRSIVAGCLILCAICFVTLFGLVSSSVAQTSSTGALSGTVTDPSGGVVAKATVTLTSLATGQMRTATTGENGSYQFSLLPPGNYSVHFEAAGFKSVDVTSVAVGVTESPTLNRKLEIGSPNVKITVEANNTLLQTDNASNGTVISGEEIESLPLVTRNYTQILDLSPGVVTNVANASTIGNGTQDVSANGSRGNQNSYSMDGANITQYTSGSAAQIGSFAGIGIPNADTIQEFKVQTSAFDAGYGRNPGANVEVITKGGSNSFHGSLLEFNRNNFFNANDFFYKRSEESLQQPNKPQILKQNTFGGTIGGPIKKDKLFFFFSYQGFRQINGIGTNGFASGYQASDTLLPWNDYNFKTDGLGCSDLRCTNDPAAYKQYLGSVFGPGTATCPGFVTGFGVPTAFPAGTPDLNCNTGFADGVTIQNNGAQITNTAVAVLQAKGLLKNGYNQGGFYLAAAPQNCALEVPGLPSSGCRIAISDPTRANENEYLGNSDFIINSKNTLQERFLYSTDPQIQSFDCLFGNCNPGAPQDVTYTSFTGTLRLTSIITNNLTNEARFTFQRNLEDSIDPNVVTSCNLPNGATIIPLDNNGQPCSDNVPLAFKQFGVIPSIDVPFGFYSPSAGWSEGGNFAATGTNIVNEFQVGDQVSWTHGTHTIRAGFDGEWDQYNNTTPASGRGEILFDNTADFLTSSSGLAIDGTPQTGLPPGSSGPPVTACGFFFGSQCAGGASPIALRGLLTHYNRINAFDAFVQDDIKVSRKLTVNLGVRWEYDGWPSDKIGQFTDVWTRQLALINTGSYFLNNAATTTCQTSSTSPPTPVGTLDGYLVPKNFDPAAGLTGPCGASGVLVNHNNTLFSGSPLHDFMPRIGVAWQPLGNRFVVRAGFGWFYDRVASTFLVDGQLNLPPYSGTAGGTSITNLENTLHSPFQATAGMPLTWTPRYLYVAAPVTMGNPNGAGGDPNLVTTVINSSALGYTANSDNMANRLPLTQEYSLDLQYDLTHGWIVDVGYVGSHSIHIFNQGTPINVAHLVDCGAASASCNPAQEAQDIKMYQNPNFPGGNPIPFNDPANATPITVNTTYNLPARVSYLGYGQTALSTTSTDGDALYNSLQAQVRHNFSHGMLFQASYTWSKDITNINAAESGELEAGQVNYGTTGSNNPLDLSQQYGLSAGQRSQRLIVSYTYTLPWKSTAGLSGHLLNGWSVSGITTVQNGQPLTITDAGGGSIYGASSSRALLAQPKDCGANGVCHASGVNVATSGGTTQRVVSGQWFNAAAFTPFSTVTGYSPYCVGGIENPQPFGPPSTTDACGTMPAPASIFTPVDDGAPFIGAGTGWGNAPIGIVDGPGQFNWDLAIQKNTKVGEWGTLQFTTQFFNLWNHPQFSNPISTAVAAGSTTFGLINSTSVAARVIQFGLHFTF
jgi:hypothetical protein